MLDIKSHVIMQPCFGVPSPEPATTGQLSPLAVHLTMNNKEGTDQAAGNTAWHADTRRERLQEGVHVIVCDVRPHLSLRLGAAAIGALFGGLVGPARVQPACLLALLPLKAVFEGGTRARLTVLGIGVACGRWGGFYITVFFRFVPESRAPVRVSSSVTLERRHIIEGKEINQ